MQVSRKVTSDPGLYGPYLAVPAVAFVPIHAADATQLLAFVVDQFSVKTPFTVLPVVKLSVGGDAPNALFERDRTKAPMSQSRERGRVGRGNARSCIILRFTVRERGKALTLPFCNAFANLVCPSL